jgi:class 3 adenylate cyclase
MPSRSNRTFICSVLFLDIVEYSKQPVAEQIRLKEHFNALLSEALVAFAPADRIILDTGDGAAVSFLGDPEAALFAGLSLREALEAPPGDTPQLRMRIGINLGPVKLVKDLNGQPNIIGDGINVAQRVMSFAQPGQLLVSRSYYEVVSCLSEEYGRLFRYEGSRTDKHVREHEVYTVGTAGPALRHSPPAESPNTAGVAAVDRLSQTATLVKDNLRRKPWLGTALAVLFILAGALVMRGHRDAPEAPDAESVPAKVAAQHREAGRSSATEAAGGQVPLSFAISPWGEIYVDGKMQGVSPPLREVEVKAGRHKIEVRNTTFPPHVETVDVQPGSRIKIRHKFR